LSLHIFSPRAFLRQQERGLFFSFRISSIKKYKGVNDIAEFAYDALGRRIEKKDLIDPNNTIRYYYNYNWQVLI